ncbi:MAG: DAK2 domain-containing protein [Solobacterium sp.]|nr:DAK2 domain-containing protein [Solobacterium sp.]
MSKINGQILKAMLESANNNLTLHKEDINKLNVFPVPDGDTGTNMSLTFSNGIQEVMKQQVSTIPTIMKTFSRGLLMGARGNSGVILSQIFRGFYQSVKEKEELDVQDLNEAFLIGKELAYKAVMRPVEGTILTVIREATDHANEKLRENAEMDIHEYIQILCEEAQKSLENTPELLPVLKEAHVVDSGGSGLVTVLLGMQAYCLGKPIVSESVDVKPVIAKTKSSSGYRTEYILRLSDRGKQNFNEERMIKNLSKMGNKLTLLHDEDTIKLRIHTMSPGEILSMGQRYGDFVKIQIENIQDQLNPSIIDDQIDVPAVENKEYGIIAVSAGNGLENIFKDYRCDFVVSGGQTMNPSSDDFVKAIDEVHANTIFILPNNSNIIMAAKQAAEVSQDKNVIVLSTTSVQQGISACVAFNPEDSVENNLEMMNEAISHVKAGSLTYAVKDTTIEGKEIHEGDFMGILNKDIVAVNPDKMETMKQLIDCICDEETEVISIFYGEESNEEELAIIQEYIESKYDVEVDIEDGGQPVYSYLIGAE